MNPAPHLCAMPGCPVLITAGRKCAAHNAVTEHRRRNYDLRAWYRTRRWRTMRAAILREQAYQCAGCHRVIAALEVDHIARHDGDPVRFWDRSNLQLLCRSCHQRKTQRGE